MGIVPVVVWDMEFSFLHIDDLVECVAQLVGFHEAPKGPFFLAHGEPVCMEQVVNIIEKYLRRPPALEYFPAAVFWAGPQRPSGN